MAEIQFDNVDSILTCFDELNDPRSHVNRLHIFDDLLVICIMAVNHHRVSDFRTEHGDLLERIMTDFITVIHFLQMLGSD